MHSSNDVASSASMKENIVNPQDQLTLSLLTACVMRQNQLLQQQNTMQHELLDHVEAVGDQLWQMQHRQRGSVSLVNQTRTRKRASKKRRLTRKKA